MTPIAQKILEHASRLSPIDRAELVERIIESFDAEPDDDVKKAWFDEAERRLAEYKRGMSEIVSEEDLFYRIEKDVK